MKLKTNHSNIREAIENSSSKLNKNLLLEAFESHLCSNTIEYKELEEIMIEITIKKYFKSFASFDDVKWSNKVDKGVIESGVGKGTMDTCSNCNCKLDNNHRNYYVCDYCGRIELK